MSSGSTWSSGYSTWSESAGKMENIERFVMGHIKEEEPDVGIDVEDPSLQGKG